MQEQKINNSFTLIKITLGFMFALVVFPSNIKAIIILLFGVSVLLHKRKWTFNKGLFLTNAALYIVILMTLFYSTDYSYAIYKLQTMSSLLVFPFVFSLFTAKETRQIFKHLPVYLSIYIVGVLLLNSVPFLWYLLTSYSFENIITHYHYLIIIGIGKYSIHPIYMSLHCCMAIIFSLFIFKSIKSKICQLLLILINFILLSFLLIYARKGPILSLLVTVFIWTIFQNRKKYYIYMTSILVIVALLIVVIPKTRERFSELLRIEDVSKLKETSTNIRYTVYGTVKELIIESPLIGYGIGDYNQKIKIRNKEKGYTNLSKKGYNSHNQYLSFLLIGGILCLATFLFLVIKNVILGLKKNNYILVLVLVFYCTSMLTENILERENGIIFFSFFLNLFALKNYKRLNSSKKGDD